MKTVAINKEQIMYMHRLLSEQTGGDPGIRDEGLLESALSSPYQTFGGEELYPTVTEKAARLGYALISNHAFVDGNKRIGVLAMLTLLRLNGVNITLTNDEVTEIGLSTASGKMNYEKLLELITEKTV